MLHRQLTIADERLVRTNYWNKIQTMEEAQVARSIADEADDFRGRG